MTQHYRELAYLADMDADIFQDTYLWMAAHPSHTRDFVREFRMRFHFLRRSAAHGAFCTGTPDIPDDQEPYAEECSGEMEEDFIKKIKDAVYQETHAKRRAKRKGARRH